jgi:hypothetical protein
MFTAGPDLVRANDFATRECRRPQKLGLQLPRLDSMVDYEQTLRTDKLGPGTASA